MKVYTLNRRRTPGLACHRSSEAYDMLSTLKLRFLQHWDHDSRSGQAQARRAPPVGSQAWQRTARREVAAPLVVAGFGCEG